MHESRVCGILLKHILLMNLIRMGVVRPATAAVTLKVLSAVLRTELESSRPVYECRYKQSSEKMVAMCFTHIHRSLEVHEKLAHQ